LARKICIYGLNQPQSKELAQALSKRVRKNTVITFSIKGNWNDLNRSEKLSKVG
jgi:hypothetical protein